jgi:hypothetical protein
MVADHERIQLLKAPVDCTERKEFMTMLQTHPHIPSVQYSVSNRMGRLLKVHVNCTKILKPLLTDYEYRSPLTNVLSTAMPDAPRNETTADINEFCTVKIGNDR